MSETSIENMSEVNAFSRSVAMTITCMVFKSLVVGVPEKIPLDGENLSHEGKGVLPSDRVALSVKKSLASISLNIFAIEKLSDPPI